MRILNMTQHVATPDQIAAGVVQPDEADHQRVKDLITFEEIPSLEELKRRARTFAALADELTKRYECHAVMIGGAPYFATEQERALWYACIRHCYAFSKRVSVEKVNDDGTLTKTQVFKHAGFIWKEVE